MVEERDLGMLVHHKRITSQQNDALLRKRQTSEPQLSYM